MPDWIRPLATTVIVLSFALGTARAEVPSTEADYDLVRPDGEVVHTADFLGQPVVLNFWAVWCPPCRAEIPTFSQFADDNPEVAVLGVAVDSGPTSGLDRVGQRLGIRYPVVDSTQEVLDAYRVAGLPTTVILDSEGRLSTVHQGLMTAEQLDLALEEARRGECVVDGRTQLRPGSTRPR